LTLRTHVLVVAVGTAGDLYPFLRIARALMARGHRVTLLGVQVHAAAAARDGVPFHALGTEAEYRAALEHPDVWHPRKGFGVLWAGMRDSLDRLPDFVAALPADEPLVMFAHPLALVGAALARARRPGLRIVAAWLAPANLRTLHDPLTIGPLRIPAWVPLAWRRRAWRWIDAYLIDRVAVPDIDAARARHGLAPIHHFVDTCRASPTRTSRCSRPGSRRRSPTGRGRWPKARSRCMTRTSRPSCLPNSSDFSSTAARRCS
jgi:rhamnosyltransferase subunit B